MSTRTQLTDTQRLLLQSVLQSQIDAMRRHSATDLDELSQTEHASKVARQDADDATQRAGDHEVEAIVADIDSGEYAALHASLMRIKGRDYGKCADCGADIPFARLQAEPQALRCSPCAALHETHA
jgi:DnaK suppressor protein